MTHASLDQIPTLVHRQQRLAARFSAGARSMAPVTGTDPRKVAHVRLTADGTIDDVKVDGGWRNLSIAPAQLAGTVMEALADAANKRFAGWAEASMEPDDAELTEEAPALADDFTERFFEAVGAGFDEDGIATVIELTEDLLAAATAATEEAERAMHARISGRSSNRHVTATSSGNGDLIGLDYDVHWLESAHSFNIGRESTEAIHDAVRSAALASLETLSALQRITEFQSVSRDPGLLAGYLMDIHRTKLRREDNR
jgi:hypothetical protein